MAGRFEGLSDLEWKLFEDIFPEEPLKRGKEMPHAPYRYVSNSLLYILNPAPGGACHGVNAGNGLARIECN